MTFTYNADYNSVLESVREALPAVGLSLKSETPTGEGTMLLARHGITAFSWGEIVRVLVEPAQSNTLVRIASERVVQPNVLAKDFTYDLNAEIHRKLGAQKPGSTPP